jgi:hypothetical protein
MWLLVILVLGVVGASLASAQLATAKPTVQLASRTGTVTAETLNVRASPALTGAKVGQLRQGAVVEIVDQRGGWLQIKFAGAPGGRGWVSANFVAIGGTPRAPGSARGSTSGGGTGSGGTTATIPAPTALDYRIPTFTWTWPGSTALDNVDWYFDIQVFRQTANDPYKTYQAFPDQVTLKDGVYSYDKLSFRPECDSYWVVQIAKRENDRWVGWVSERSNRLDVGRSCGGGGGGGGGVPEPEPTVCPPDCS